MMTTAAAPAFAMHPGIWVRAELVQPLGYRVSLLARSLGVTRQALSAFLNGRAGLSAEMAIRLEKAFGLSAETLMRMQAAHELAAARAIQDRIKVERLRAAA